MGGGSSKTHEAKATPDVTVEEKDGKDGERVMRGQLLAAALSRLPENAGQQSDWEEFIDDTSGGLTISMRRRANQHGRFPQSWRKFFARRRSTICHRSLRKRRASVQGEGAWRLLVEVYNVSDGPRSITMGALAKLLGVPVEVVKHRKSCAPGMQCRHGW